MTKSSKLMFILRVSSRYLRSKRSRSSKFINLVSFIGLVLGLTLLIVVLSVLNGTREAIDDDFFEVSPHAIARVSSDRVKLIEELRALPEVISVEPFVDLYVLLSAQQGTTNTESGFVVYGFDSKSSNRTFRQMHSAINEEHDLPAAGLDFVVASRYGLSLGDVFTITVPLATERGVRFKTVAMRYARALLLGAHLRISNILYVELDDLLAHGLISEDGIHYRITLDEPSQAVGLLGDYPEVVTWTEHYGSFFQALAMEKMILFILLLFVVGLVTMNVVSGQAMLINSKSSDIAILQTMGAELRWISLVFVFQSAIVVLAGIIVGTVFGCVLARNAHQIIQFLPLGRQGLTILLESAVVAPRDLVWTTIFALLVGFLAILRPLNLVYRKDPVESLSRTV